MSRSTLVFAVLAVFVPASLPASAQGVAPAREASRGADASAPDDDADDDLASAALADARYVNDVGMGLTIAGLTSTGLGAGLLFGLGHFGGATAGGVFLGLGGLVGLAGIPTWIVGSVRSSVLAASPANRSGVAWSFELAGIVTTVVAIGILLVGGALLVAGIASSDGAHLGSSETLRGTAGVLIPIGSFVATFIGAPLWAEGARF